MEDYLKHYNISLKTLGPIHVGNGRKIVKKEYLFLDNNSKIAVLDSVKLYEYLKTKEKERYFEKYLLDNNKDSLRKWLNDNKIRQDEIKRCFRYEIDCGDLKFEKGKKEIKECIKDAYFMPYIPGSSIKGALRTILLIHDIIKEKNKYRKAADEIYQQLKRNKNAQLSRQTGEIESNAFRTLNRPNTKPEDVVNDIFQGVIISDSEPINIEDIILCQKKDVATDGKINNLPIFCESIKPGTEIRFSMTIDTKVCNFDTNYIKDSIETYSDIYNDFFANKYNNNYCIGNDSFFLGGGSGFATKTIDYALFGEDGVDVVCEILSQKFRKISRNTDRKKGVSPRMMKTTSYGGKQYQMGLCRLLSIK